jgi:hypothetical protein
MSSANAWRRYFDWRARFSRTAAAALTLKKHEINARRRAVRRTTMTPVEEPLVKVRPPLWLVVVFLTVLPAAAARAQAPGPPGREGRFMAGAPVHPVVQALDADGDGVLSAAEIDNAPAALRKLDKDRNGKLTGDEIRPAFGRFGGREPRGPDPSELVTRMLAFDKDGDGKLSQAELPERMKTLADTADTNKDGFIDRAELTKLAEDQARAAREGRRGEGGGGPRERRPGR